jgi:diguanylate cyclase (GGDEF)-like protein/PAS domain S-box-containing protein
VVDPWSVRYQLSASEFAESASVGLIVFDADGVVVDCNSHVVRQFRISREDFLGFSIFSPLWSVHYEDGSRYSALDLPGMATLRTGEPCYDVVIGIDITGNERRWLSVNACRAEVNGEEKGVVVSTIDITERIARERMLRLRTEINRVVISAKSETQSLRQLCTTLVVNGGYALAWVAVESSTVVGGIDVAFADGATGYLDEITLSSLLNLDVGNGPTGSAMRERTNSVVNDVGSDPLLKPWREVAMKYELRSSIGIPFSPGGMKAVLCVYSHFAYAFDQTTTQGLEDIVNEVEFGVSHVQSVRQTEVALDEAIVAIRAQELAEQLRSESEQRFRIAFEDNIAPMSFSDLDDHMIAVNDAFCEMVGFSREELLGSDSTIYTLPDDMGITEESLRFALSGTNEQSRYVKRYLCKDGRIIVVEVSRSPALDEEGNILYFVFSERDVTEQYALTQQLSYQALHDPLTGLANRALFEDRLSQARSRALRQDATNAVLLLDLDDFKGVNDTYGHPVGDRLLSEIGHRLEKIARSTDTLCRFGGDEFLYLAEDVGGVTEAEVLATRVLEALEAPFVISGTSFVQRASIGVVVWDKTRAEIGDIVQNADVALYEAKRQGRGTYVIFTPSMHQQAVSRFTLVQELGNALHSGELSMHYQPIVDLATNQVIGFEALMRWDHPQRGRVAPDVFIALAEQSDLIVELGTFALHEALAEATKWKEAFDDEKPPFVTVNLSGRQFHDPNLVTYVETELARNSCDPERLILEVTEGIALLDIDETLNTMSQLNELGVGIALDDFGTGFSSLSYLAQLRPKLIKIDQSFVRPATSSRQSDAVLELIILLGQKLNITILAEGVETYEQLDRLLNLGCELGQGYLWSPAVRADEVRDVLTFLRSTTRQ